MSRAPDRAPTLTREEAQSIVDALDTLEGSGITPITADLSVLANAWRKMRARADQGDWVDE